jgi:hypothetical protein
MASSDAQLTALVRPLTGSTLERMLLFSEIFDFDFGDPERRTGMLANDKYKQRFCRCGGFLIS